MKLTEQSIREVRTGLLKYRWGIVVAGSILLSALSLYASFLIRFDGDIPPRFMMSLIRVLPFAVAFRVIALEYFNLHRGLWRYAGMDDLVRIVKACSASSLALIIAIVFVYHTEGFPRSVFMIDWVLSMFLVGGVRGATRIFRERYATQSPPRAQGRVLIIGAGDTAELAIRDLRSQTAFRRDIIGFLDDNPSKQGMTIHGFRVLGKLADFRQVLEQRSVTEVLIAMPSAPARIVREVVHMCAEIRIQARIIPAISDYVSGTLEFQPVRKVEIADLLGREPVQLDGNIVRNELNGKTVLVTGAGGSIGSELARQVAACAPGKMVMLENAESALFDITNEITEIHPELVLVPLIANIRDEHALRLGFAQHRPHRVFHAAAYKHVPLMEAHPLEAIRNNVLGTDNLARIAIETGVERFVLISTDKAVKPENVMGATKRVAEMLMKHYSCEKTRFLAVRFGNVLGSVGSVVPIFKRQISEGGPVCITHAEATRFFMTIPEAALLVLQVGVTTSDGDIFVLDMGNPVRIVDLARNMIELSGMVPDEDIEIRVVGLRPGEKIHEELEAYGENLEPLDIPKINVLRTQEQTTPVDIEDALASLKSALDEGDATLARELLMTIAKTNTV